MDSIFDAVHRAQQRCDAIFFEETGISPRRYFVLLAIKETYGLIQNDIKRRTGFDRSTTSEMLIRLESEGLIFRVAAETDSRSKRIYLTRAGSLVLHNATKSAQKAENEIADILGNGFESAMRALIKIGEY